MHMVTSSSATCSLFTGAQHLQEEVFGVWCVLLTDVMLLGQKKTVLSSLMA